MQLFELGGHEHTPEQADALRRHAETYAVRQAEVEIELRRRLVAWAPLFCTCRMIYRPLVLGDLPAYASCVIHGQLLTTKDGELI